MRKWFPVVALLAGCARSKPAPMPTTAETCTGEPEIVEAPGTGAMFPVLTLKNAEPGIRVKQTIHLPTRLVIEPTSDNLMVGLDAPLEVVDIQAGCHMILGTNITISADGGATTGELRGGADFGAGGARSALPLGAKTFHATITVFETDVPPQHEWMPEGSHYSVLLTRTIDAKL